MQNSIFGKMILAALELGILNSMKKVFQSLALGFGGLFALIVLAGLILPKEFKVVSSVDVQATPQEVHALVGDLKEWPKWAPWNQEGSEIKIQLSEQTSGVGATQTWQDPAGKGKLVFTYSNPKEGIQYDVFFDESPQAQIGQIAYVSLSEGKTQVSWVMKGKVDALLGGILATIFPSMIRPMFDQGLSRLSNILAEQKEGIKS